MQNSILRHNQTPRHLARLSQTPLSLPHPRLPTRLPHRKQRIRHLETIQLLPQPILRHAPHMQPWHFAKRKLIPLRSAALDVAALLALVLDRAFFHAPPVLERVDALVQKRWAAQGEGAL